MFSKLHQKLHFNIRIGINYHVLESVVISDSFTEFNAIKNGTQYREHCSDALDNATLSLMIDQKALFLVEAKFGTITAMRECCVDTVECLHLNQIMHALSRERFLFFILPIFLY